MYASAIVQASPTGEISFCVDNDYSGSTSKIDYIYTLDIKYNDELKEKTKKYPFFPEITKVNVDQFIDYQDETKIKMI